MEIKTQYTQIYGCSQSSAQREVIALNAYIRKGEMDFLNQKYKLSPQEARKRAN